MPSDLLTSAGEKKSIWTCRRFETKAEALVKVIALDRWLPKLLQSQLNRMHWDLDKTVTAVLTDGSLIDTDVVSWTLKDPAALNKEGGRTVLLVNW